MKFLLKLLKDSKSAGGFRVGMCKFEGNHTCVSQQVIDYHFFTANGYAPLLKKGSDEFISCLFIKAANILYSRLRLSDDCPHQQEREISAKFSHLIVNEETRERISPLMREELTAWLLEELDRAEKKFSAHLVPYRERMSYKSKKNTKKAQVEA